MTVAWWEVSPFAALLIIIALAPLVSSVKHQWEKPTVQLAVSLIFGVPVAVWFIVGGDGMAIADSLVEYGQFICLLLALYVISGGITLRGNIIASPRNNTVMLAVGAVAASIVGTTGAAMLLIRPLLKTNSERVHRMHTIVFAIFIVANSGGLLTPIGDPPLFLGMLRGVPFFWTLTLWPQWLFVNAILLVTFYALDRRAYARESPESRALDTADFVPLRLAGSVHFAYLATVVAAIAFVPSIDMAAIEDGTATVGHGVIPWREILMVAALLASFVTGPRTIRYRENSFEWAPIAEVAAIFVGIFLTMTPALKYLASVAPSLPLNDVTLFVFTGGLSSVLDNAPTYATFFEMAKTLPGDPRVAGVPESMLVAISVGAVFCGALTYIGNGPNFMVKSIAERSGVAMPSFGGYTYLAVKDMAPVLVAMALLFIADSWWAIAAGLLMTAVLLLRATVLARAG